MSKLVKLFFQKWKSLCVVAWRKGVKPSVTCSETNRQIHDYSKFSSERTKLPFVFSQTSRFSTNNWSNKTILRYYKQQCLRSNTASNQHQLPTSRTRSLATCRRIFFITGLPATTSELANTVISEVQKIQQQWPALKSFEWSQSDASFDLDVIWDGENVQKQTHFMPSTIILQF